MTTDEFSKSVDMGLRLSKRIYYGKDGPPMHAPKPATMTKCPTLRSTSSCSSFRFPNRHQPTAPMVYAVISEPDIVDNPDIRSYQPHVHGRCNPPALIPLVMHAVSMNVECVLDSAFVVVSGDWHVHCVTASACCDCLVVVPMGEQGSLLDIDVETSKRSYFTKLIVPDDGKVSDQIAKSKDGFMMNHNTYTLKIPQVEGGSVIHVKVRWSQKLLYEDDQFCLSVPFTFPSYVLPLEKTIPKIEKVFVNVISGTDTMITCRFSSHPLKELQQQSGEASFLYEAEVLRWSIQDFYFAYSGSLLDIDVETSKRSYFTKLIVPDDGKVSDQIAKSKDGFMMNHNTYTLKIPQVEGGSVIHVKVRWSQKLLYEDDQFCLSVPFTFPSYVLPLEKTIPKIEKVFVNVISGTDTMITCRFSSHPLKELQQQSGEASFLYEAEVLRWSIQDFYFAYSGSLLDIDVETSKRSYFTKLIVPDDGKVSDQIAKSKDGFMMNHNTYTLKIPQVEGGSVIHVKVRWSQKLLYEDDQFCLSVPFTFPSYVLPLEKTIPKIEKVFVNVISGTDTMITCRFSSHPLKELQQQSGEASFLYEAEVLRWSIQDFYFAYSVCSNEVIGGLLLQRPSLYDLDQRDMFCFYLFPGTNKDNTVYKKEIIFLLDISGSMRGDPLEKSKYAITASLSNLDHGDWFNIIAFNGDVQSFSSSLELATEETITNATEWMWSDLVAEGATNLMSPLKQAIGMFGKTGESIPLIFLITDGTVEDERDICNMIKCSLVDGGSNSPRIYTFGIGSYCNHYFLQMLAYIGRGYYDSAHETDSIGERMQRLLDNALAPVLTNVTLDALENLKSYELFPSRIPDLLTESPLIISGRSQGDFPESVKVRGLQADQTTCIIDIKVRNITGIQQLDKVCAMREVDILTAQAWLDQNTHMEARVANISLQRGVPSEYTNMILVQNNMPDKKGSKSTDKKMMLLRLRNTCVGFGNLKATTENLAPGAEDVKLNEAAKMVMKAASSCYGFMVGCACWRCLMQTWSLVRNDQCALAIAQLCTAFACLECLDCCCELCDDCMDLCQ